jgi:hypothetical protein
MLNCYQIKYERSINFVVNAILREHFEQKEDDKDAGNNKSTNECGPIESDKPITTNNATEVRLEPGERHGIEDESGTEEIEDI